MKLVVVIPAFNEEHTIAQAVTRLPKAIRGLDIIEPLVVDDGSTDRTPSWPRRPSPRCGCLSRGA